MPKIIFKDKNIVIDVEKGTSILEAAMEQGISLYHTCGGNCSCSTCRVVITKNSENLSEASNDELLLLDSFDLAPPHRLGCQAKILRGEVELVIPDHSKAPRPNKTPKLPGD